MNKFQSFKAGLTFRKAVDMADKAHAKTGERYYVLPNADETIHLIVANRTNFRRLRSKGYINHDMKIEDAKKVSFYYTNDKSEQGGVPPEAVPYMALCYESWYEQVLERRKVEKAKKRRLRREKIKNFFRSR